MILNLRNLNSKINVWSYYTLRVQGCTVNSYTQSKYINYSENTITTLYIYFFVKLESIKMQVIQILFKVCVSPTNSLNWKGNQQSHPNPHTNQLARLIDMKSSAAQQPTPLEHSEILGNNRLLLMKLKKLVVVQ